MTITRTPMCRVDYCPAPRDPDAHVCPHCGGVVVQHQHIVPRGMGGSKSRKYDRANVVMICPWLHEEITLHRLSDGIVQCYDYRVYRVWDVHNNTVCESRPYWIQDISNGSSAVDVADSPSMTAELHGTGGTPPEVVMPHPPVPLDILAELPPDLTYEQWCAWGEVLGRYHNVTAYRIGQWLAYGEDKGYGGKYTQGMDATGKSYSTLSTYVSVVTAIDSLPSSQLSSSMSMSVLTPIASVARRDAEEAENLLLRAAEERWTGEQSRAAVKALTGVDDVVYETCSLNYQHRVK